MRYIIPRSYVTDVNSCTYSNGAWYYPSNTASHFQVDFTSCANAISKYQAVMGTGSSGSRNADRTGLHPASGDNTPSTLKKQKAAFEKQKKESKLGSLPSLPNLDNTTPNSDVNPASKCHNCGNDWWNPLQWGCVLFTKPACELQVAWNQGVDGIGKWFGNNALLVAGGGILVIIIASTILGRM